MAHRDFLQEILSLKRKRVEQAKLLKPDWKESFSVKNGRQPNLLHKALRNEGINIIAEIKRASPSKGIINDNVDVCETAVNYKRGGACAISVLTEEDRFKGSLEDLTKVRQVVDLPILRKDFIFDEFQIYEAKSAGADAVLLIAAMLDKADLKRLLRLTEDLGLDALVEIHTLDELKTALDVGAKILGVNNRNLHTFEVSLDVSRQLIKHVPKDILTISESGISRREEILELKELGFSGFLIGETLMRSHDLSLTLKSLYDES